MNFDPNNLLQFLPTEQIMRTIPSGLFLVDRQQRIMLWNAEAERITGFPASEALGKHCSFLQGIPCGEGCGLYNPDLTKPLIGVECTIITRDGRRINLLKNVDYLREPSGDIIGGIESFIEITQQVELESQLRHQAGILEQTVHLRTRELEEERSRLRAVLDSMTDLAYITTPDFRIDFMNRSMQEIFGQCQGQPCYRTIHGQSDICSWCPMPDVLAERTVCLEMPLEINGRTYEVIHSPLRESENRIQKLAVFRDITERKLAEERLREANRELDAFAYTVSHDLLSPLTPILGFVELLRAEFGESLGEKGLDYLQEIETQGEKMVGLMEDLLDLARVGWIEPPEEAVDVTELVRGVIEELSLSDPERPMTVKHGELPSLRLPATLIRQLFSNLLSNARRYGDKAGADVEIVGTETDDRIIYNVIDHGPGIPAEEKERIFELFYRGATSEGIPGTGIGLATVRKIVRMYGGRTRVTGTPGGGSTFWLEFPSRPPLAPA